MSCTAPDARERRCAGRSAARSRPATLYISCLGLVSLFTTPIHAPSCGWGIMRRMRRRTATSAPVVRSGAEVYLSERVAADQADEHGFLRAGKVLEWMDVVGVVAAARHCHQPVVTTSIDALELRDPIRLGDRVAMTAR